MAKNESKATQFEEVGLLKLRKPIMFDGAAVNELTYDFSALTVKDMLEVDKQFGRINGNLTAAPALNDTYQLLVFTAAVQQAHPGFELEDTKRMGMRDGREAAGLALSFFMFNAKDSEDEISES